MPPLEDAIVTVCYQSGIGYVGHGRFTSTHTLQLQQQSNLSALTRHGLKSEDDWSLLHAQAGQVLLMS